MKLEGGYKGCVCERLYGIDILCGREVSFY